MAALIILSIILLVILIKFGKSLWYYCTTKVEAEEKDEYFDYDKNHFFTKEELTRRMERQRKATCFVMIACITMPLWFVFAVKFIFGTLLVIGTILFCIELLAKGSGIK